MCGQANLVGKAGNSRTWPWHVLISYYNDDDLLWPQSYYVSTILILCIYQAHLPLQFSFSTGKRVLQGQVELSFALCLFTGKVQKLKNEILPGIPVY